MIGGDLQMDVESRVKAIAPVLLGQVTAQVRDGKDPYTILDSEQAADAGSADVTDSTAHGQSQSPEQEQRIADLEEQQENRVNNADGRICLANLQAECAALRQQVSDVDTLKEVLVTMPATAIKRHTELYQAVYGVSLKEEGEKKLKSKGSFFQWTNWSNVWLAIGAILHATAIFPLFIFLYVVLVSALLTFGF